MYGPLEGEYERSGRTGTQCRVVSCEGRESTQLSVSNENKTPCHHETALHVKRASSLMIQDSHLQDQGPSTLALQTPFSRGNYVSLNVASQNKAAPQVSIRN